MRNYDQRAAFRFCRNVLVVAAGLLVIADASAQTATPGRSETGVESTALAEVVVTARRKEERLQDVPLSVSAFSADQLSTLGITDQVTLAKFTPGFQFSDYTNGRSDRGAFRSMIFRGLTSSLSNTGVTSYALAFLDGAPIIFGDILLTDAIERVEVLKGPQNVYFGRSTFAGAINYVTRSPGNVFKGSATAEVGSYGLSRLSGHFEGPLISDKLTFAIDAEDSNKGGDYTNAAFPSEKFGARSSKSVALTQYWTPTDKLSVKLYETYFHYDDGIGAAGVIPSPNLFNCRPGGNGGGAVGNFYRCGELPTFKPSWLAQSNVYTAIENQLLNHPAGFNVMYKDCNHLGLCADAGGASAIIDYALPWADTKFQSITAYHAKLVADLQNAVDQNVNAFPNVGFFGNPAYPNAPTYAPTFDYNIINKLWDFSTEARLSSADRQRLRWTVGASYVETSDTQQLWFYTNPTGTIPVPDPAYSPQLTSARTVGVFGGLYFDVTDSTTVSAELRRQSDRRRDRISANSQYLEKTFDSWSPRIAVQYKLTPTTNLYASYAGGVRPGGFNTAITGLPARIASQIAALVGTAPLAYDEEKIWTTEVGIKGEFFDRALQANVSAYIGKLSNQQLSQTAILLNPDPVYGGRFDIYTNSGKVDLHGLEADARWRVSRLLTLSGTFGWTYTAEHATGCNACLPVTGSDKLDGTRLNNSPEISGSLAADLSDNLTANLDWFAHADFAYKGSMYIDQNGLNLTETGAAKKVNLQIGVENKSYTITAYVTNLTDDKTYTGGQVNFDFLSFSPNGVRFGLPDKRAYGVRLRYNFD